MPEAYTHVRIARKALKALEMDCENKAAFEMGANGPDPLFSYNIFSKSPLFPMQELGKRIHKECCGVFLSNMVQLAKTTSQRWYTLGFLTHNAADALIHPYVAFITGTGQRYNRPSGHGFFEIAFDSTLYKKDYATPCVSVKHTAPELTPLELAEIATLLRDCVHYTYNQDVAMEGIVDSFHDFRALHKQFASKYGFKKAIGFLVETLILHKPGLALSHMTPAKLSKHLPVSWHNPFTGDNIDGTAFDLLLPAEQVSMAFIKSAFAYWNGQLSTVQLNRLIGDHSYETGLEGTKNEEALLPQTV